jgi:mRNA interferase HigB
VRIITYKAIEQYSELHADAKVALDEWYIKTEQKQWNCFVDIKQTFNSVDIGLNMSLSLSKMLSLENMV